MSMRVPGLNCTPNVNTSKWLNVNPFRIDLLVLYENQNRTRSELIRSLSRIVLIVELGLNVPERSVMREETTHPLFLPPGTHNVQPPKTAGMIQNLVRLPHQHCDDKWLTETNLDFETLKQLTIGGSSEEGSLQSSAHAEVILLSTVGYVWTWANVDSLPTRLHWSIDAIPEAIEMLLSVSDKHTPSTRPRHAPLLDGDKVPTSALLGGQRAPSNRATRPSSQTRTFAPAFRNVEDALSSHTRPFAPSCLDAEVAHCTLQEGTSFACSRACSSQLVRSLRGYHRASRETCLSSLRGRPRLQHHHPSCIRWRFVSRQTSARTARSTLKHPQSPALPSSSFRSVR
jgi:hypothetical protein